ncbi:MAG: 16S rRNA (guanine(966)-N(2))-methyltransferase RsmD [Deltaproteobacteria bacterium]|nr:16S rRNA (guanine(966)-N(2))-methyltransferase RsmD [Deltaproteobacteria bacterium]
MRGRRLKAPSGRTIRPTSDRIRESIFDLLGPQLSGQSVLDLFAGTGAMGLEALSRGFERAVFVELARTARVLIDENIALCKIESSCRVVAADVGHFLKTLDHQAPFDLILLDPPYGSELPGKVLAALGKHAWLAKAGRVVCETEVETELSDSYGSLARVKLKRYGSTAIHIFRNQ